MRSIKITGLCLVAMFAMSMAAAATASAGVWQQCQKGAAGTKWTNSECNVASSTGEWAWQEVTTTEKVFSTAALKLEDTNVLFVGRVAVECFGTDEGTIGPKQFDRVEKVRVGSCKNVEHCTEGTVTAEAIHLPWQTELFQTENRTRDKITEVPPNGQPGYNTTCNTSLARSTDECVTETGKEGSTLMTNIQETGIVQAEFETKSGTAKCSLGGAKNGHVWGIVQFGAVGYAIRVS
jgi:hypothetical protein